MRPQSLYRLAALSVLLGRAYQHLFWDAPFRALLWDETRMRPLIETLFALSWKEWVTKPASQAGIQHFITAMGGFYLLAALVVLFAERLPKKGVQIVLTAATAFLVLLALMYWKEKFFHLGQLFEYSLQIAALPLFMLSQNGGMPALRARALFIKAAIALTFICHGLYAIGAYPRPGDFVTMLMQGLWLSEEQAIIALYAAGLLDFTAAALLFAPELASRLRKREFLARRLFRIALWYCIIWGLLTALARVWAHFYLPFWLESLHQWTWQTIVRFPHFLIPLALLLQENRKG